MESSYIQRLYSAYQRVPEPLKKCIRPLAQSARGTLRRQFLSEEQLRFWDESGYLILDRFFTKHRVAQINGIVDYLWQNKADEPHMPYMAEVYLRTPKARRQLMRGLEDDARNQLYKLYDLYLEFPVLRDFVLDRVLSDILKTLFNGDPVISGTINFEWGSEQEFHFDDFYMQPAVNGEVLTTWIALEDITPKSGPLKLLPKSHKIPPHRVDATASDEKLLSRTKYFEEQVGMQDLEEITFNAKQGDVLILHERLLHGGAQRPKCSNSTCKCLVTHYWRSEDLHPAIIRCDRPGTNYLFRPPHPATHRFNLNEGRK